jgi:two-component system, NarL family, sensor histidine kinase DesK
MSNPAIPPKPHSHNWAWLWLAYTGFLFLDPILDPHLYQWLGTLVVFGVFLLIFRKYVLCADEGEPTRFWMIGATFALGLIAFPWNQGSSCLMVYAFCFLPFAIESIRRVLLLYALGVLIILGESVYFHRWHGAFHVSWINAFIAVFLVLVIGGGNIFFAEQKRFNMAQAKAERDLHAAQEENLALAAVAERERIARDLHDVLGHTLSVIVLKAELAGRLISLNTEEASARATTEIADVERTARTALAEVREAIGGYRTRGLAAEIEAARRTLDAAGVTLTVADNPDTTTTHPGAGAPQPALSLSKGLASETWDANANPAAALSSTEETVLALALREAVTNIVRHARATTCTLRFITDSGIRRLIVEDNGASPAPPREGNGLRGMRARIESIGGHLQLQHGNASSSDLARGTRLLITLPHPSQASA